MPDMALSKTSKILFCPHAISLIKPRSFVSPIRITKPVTDGEKSHHSYDDTCVVFLNQLKALKDWLAMYLLMFEAVTGITTGKS